MINIVEKPSIALFITCLANTMRPSIGFAAITLLEQAGCTVEVPESQSCCGQPAYNSGDDEGTRSIAKQTIPVLESYDYVVAPSGSCAAMIKYWPDLFEKGSQWHQRANQLAAKTWELLSFLTDVRHFQPATVSLEGSYTYHDSCSGLRSLGVYEQPRQLLKHADKLTYKPMTNSTECCGFGGTFCVKYSNISDAIVSEKVDNILNTEADFLLGGDWGCLMNMAGKLNREHPNRVIAFHTAEVMAGLATDIMANSAKKGA